MLLLLLPSTLHGASRRWATLPTHPEVWPKEMTNALTMTVELPTEDSARRPAGALLLLSFPLKPTMIKLDHSAVTAEYVPLAYSHGLCGCRGDQWVRCPRLLSGEAPLLYLNHFPNSAQITTLGANGPVAPVVSTGIWSWRRCLGITTAVR